jgi:hypothetical protein
MTDHYANRSSCVIRGAGLTRKLYELRLTDPYGGASPKLRLVDYRVQSRPTKRHGWKDVVVYPAPDRYRQFDHITYPERDQIILPDDVIAEYFARILAKGVQ